MKQWKKSLGIVLTVAAVTTATPVGAGAAEPVQPIPLEVGISDLDAPVSHIPSEAKPGEGRAPVEALPESILPESVLEGKVKWAERVTIAFDNEEITSDQGPVVTEEGILLVPLRAVVEAAGGNVVWDEATQAVSATVAGRTALFGIGSQVAQLAPEEGKAAVEMSRAPVIIGGRTLISEDALVSVLGLKVQTRESGLVNLVLQAAPEEEELPEEAAGEENKLTGTITEIKVEEGKILVEGEPMANGEPSLTWVTLTDDTGITIGAEGNGAGATIGDLEVGQEVEIVLSGAVLMSYPAQAGASAVVVLDR
ncbi:MAG TPA: copper amine oxidase N-terminal domain-containing protein [Firmicutes bacterium]|jgi:hypothetical protein|nr:copper amine oxidase N-terminal domain-containing protein [Bacillota bacterium]